MFGLFKKKREEDSHLIHLYEAEKLRNSLLEEELEEASVALGEYWMKGASDLAEGIRRKTEFLEKMGGVSDSLWMRDLYEVMKHEQTLPAERRTVTPAFMRALCSAEREKLLAFIGDIGTNWDCDEDAHRYNATCRSCEAQKLMAEFGVEIPEWARRAS